MLKFGMQVCKPAHFSGLTTRHLAFRQDEELGLKVQREKNREAKDFSGQHIHLPSTQDTQW